MNTIEAYDTVIGLEKGFSNIYHRFASLFRDKKDIYNFWNGLAATEKGHSEALILSKGSLKDSVRKSNFFKKEELKRLEDLKCIAREWQRKSFREGLTLQEAIDMLLKVEKTGLHYLYEKLAQASGINIKWSLDDHKKRILPFIQQHKGYGDTVKDILIPEIVSMDTDRKTILQGNIIEIEKETLYGLIKGEDGQTYMFLPEDLPPGGWEGIELNRKVEFSVLRFPWGPRAQGIRYV